MPLVPVALQVSVVDRRGPIHVSVRAPVSAAMNSASVLKCDTVAWHAEAHTMGCSDASRSMPVVDRRMLRHAAYTFRPEPRALLRSRFDLVVSNKYASCTGVLAGRFRAPQALS